VFLISACCCGGLAATARFATAAGGERSPAQVAKSMTTASSRAAWMPRGTFGVMTHYRITPKGNTPAKRIGGALTINVPIDVETGLIPEDSHSQLVRLGKAISVR